MLQRWGLPTNRAERHYIHANMHMQAGLHRPPVRSTHHALLAGPVRSQRLLQQHVHASIAGRGGFLQRLLLPLQARLRGSQLPGEYKRVLERHVLQRRLMCRRNQFVHVRLQVALHGPLLSD